ncbi:unnamed protein product [Enterobius vermicularis]|uniref:Ground-like domain-containing protein n=1 Tax=Enterobius vermicularis TaxID=51028 RepID=A0A0N4VLK2_ENTVE|nr:unnamed protein product [Enterobius vermicularis]
MICQHANRHNRAYHQRTGNIKKSDDSCTHIELKALMSKVITKDPDESKRAILHSAEETLGGQFHVICSKDDFSYITKSSTYCQITENDLTCYAFQTPKIVSN